METNKSNILKQRLENLGLTRYEVAKRIAEKENKAVTSVNNTVDRCLSNPDIAQVSTLKKIVEALGGEIVIKWKAEDVL